MAGIMPSGIQRSCNIMTRSRRLLIEILIPPLLGAIIVACSGRTADNAWHIIFGFPAFLMFAYAFGIVPSAIYAAAMEFWFKKGCHYRYGLVSTVVFSALLGLGAGFGIQFLIQGVGITYFLFVGLVVGLIVGFYVGRAACSSTRGQGKGSTI